MYLEGLELYLTLVLLNNLRCHSPFLIFSESKYLILLVAINSLTWLQKPTDLDLHALQRQGMYGFSKTRVFCSFTAVVEEVTTTPDPTDKTPIIIGVVIGSLLFLILIGVIIFLCIYCNRDPNAGKPIIENTKPRFEGKMSSI